ncbi:MAG: ABC transporter ATP-binding protein [Gammaproteobacteria bacterium]|nr:ABC transporter ATP-binding protein [Gammaproteobacteria bacterium]
MLAVEELRVAYGSAEAPLEAVRGVTLALAAGECVGVVGESASGKTQLCLATMGLLGRGARVSGRVRFAGEDLVGMPLRRLNQLRGARLAMVFQDPQTALTPHLRIGTQMAEVLVVHRGAGWSAARAAALAMLGRVGIEDPGWCLERYPHELSGGMRQRVLIGACLLSEPQLLVADEPTTALDVTVQAQVLELLARMRRESGMAILLVSHDLAVVAGLADRIAVMYAGRIVELAATARLLSGPRHPYSAALLQCVPDIRGPIPVRLPTLPGQPPAIGERAGGCPFAPRCERREARCLVETPPLTADDEGGAHACHRPLPARAGRP